MISGDEQAIMTDLKEKQDEQIKRKYPNCEGCGIPWGMVYYGPKLLCGNCVQKLIKKQHKWIQEALDDE